jgi:arylsulfatase A-like enzyme
MNRVYDRRDLLWTLGTAALAASGTLCAARKQPNFILILADDQGYSDVGCYGATLIRTPRLDRMAQQGVRFTQFYTQVVCGPSRAALMTGSYPMRVAEPGNKKRPHTELHAREITIAEMLKTRGYTNACLGKWHLGLDNLPRQQGFDYFFGTPLFNGSTRYANQSKFVCQLRRNEEIIERPANMNTLTARYTDEAVRFISENRTRPFFLYLAHNMPHVPLGVSDAFRGRSKRGLYGDVIEEMDWSTGKILDTLKELGLESDTLVVYTSDNGPWIEPQIGEDGGSANPLRGSKQMTWEGGVRVPCIMTWPGVIPAGTVCREVATTMDLFPTFARLAHARLPGDRVIDGKDIFPLLQKPATAKSRHEVLYYYCFTHLQAVRSGRWKLVLPRPAHPKWLMFLARLTEEVKSPELYDLDADMEERNNVAAKHPDVVARLMGFAENAREDLGDYDRIGKGARFFDGPPPKTPQERDAPNQYPDTFAR